MRIALLANRDLPANRVIDALLRALPEHRFSLLLSSSVGRPGPRPAALQDLAVHEQQLPYELIDPLLQRAGKDSDPLRMRTWRELAVHLEDGCHALDRPRSAEGRSLLQALAPDLIVSVRYGGILDAEHVAAVPLGILNLHSGRLPAYRGVLATFRALAAGDPRLGCTLHRIVDAGIDTGPIIAEASIPAAPERSMLWNLMQLYEPGTRLIIDAVQAMARGEPLPGTPQDPEAGAYFGIPDEAVLSAYQAGGGALARLDDTVNILARLFAIDVPIHGSGVRS